MTEQFSDESSLDDVDNSELKKQVTFGGDFKLTSRFTTNSHAGYIPQPNLQKQGKSNAVVPRPFLGPNLVANNKS